MLADHLICRYGAGQKKLHTSRTYAANHGVARKLTRIM
jgi:tRNA isopentenyl-2-thiomethyl-A-37 hydroxylase MiaE